MRCELVHYVPGVMFCETCKVLHVWPDELATAAQGDLPRSAIFVAAVHAFEDVRPGAAVGYLWVVEDHEMKTPCRKQHKTTDYHPTVLRAKDNNDDDDGNDAVAARIGPEPG